MPPSARQPGRWVTLNWTFKHLNVNLWAKSASEELDNTIAMQCCESSSCIKEICFTVFPIGNSSHSDQVKHLTNMSVNLSLKALKEMDYWKKNIIIQNQDLLLPPKLLGSSWFNAFTPLIWFQRVAGSVFCILSFDICVDICCCLPNNYSLWKYFDILHFNIF